MFIMYSVVDFDDMDTLMNHQAELEHIFKNKVRYSIKMDIETIEDKYRLRTKIVTICPN